MDLRKLLIGVPAQADGGQKFARWRNEAKSQSESATDDEIRLRLRLLLGIGDYQDRSPEIRIQTGFAGGDALLVHPDWIEAARKSTQAKVLKAQGKSIHFVQLSKPPFRWRKDRNRSDLTFNYSGDAKRVRELVAAIHNVASLGHGKPRLICLAEAGPWCLAAGAASTDGIELQAELTGLEPEDECLSRKLFIPGLQRIGGLPALARLAGVH